MNNLTELGGRVPLWLPVLPVPLLSLPPAALKGQVSHRHATHTKQATAASVDEKDVRCAPLLTARKHFGVVGLFFLIQDIPHLHILVQEDFNGKRENQSKALMAVRHNSVEATAASQWHCKHEFHTKRYTRVNMCKSELVACGGEPKPE